MTKKKAPKAKARCYLTIDVTEDLRERWRVASEIARREDPDMTFSRWCRRSLTTAAAKEEKKDGAE